MGRLLINPKDIKSIIEDFFDKNKDYILKSYTPSDKKIIIRFTKNGIEGKLDLHLTSNGITHSLSKDRDLGIPIIEHLESQGIKDEASGTQTVIKFPEILSEMLEYVEEKYSTTISIEQQKNRYILRGYNNDKIVLTSYPKNFLIQGKPYYVYHILLTYLADNEFISFDNYIDINQDVTNAKLSSATIRDKIKDKLVNSYSYMEEAQLKSISGTYSFLNENIKAEDYSSPLTGVFKALEGFMKKILTQKFEYKFSKNESFTMLGNDPHNSKNFYNDPNISNEIKRAIKSLYDLYRDQRNIYLHSTVDPKSMKIIENLKEAIELRDEILDEIEKAYVIIFR